jgi:hypothetical protein
MIDLFGMTGSDENNRDKDPNMRLKKDENNISRGALRGVYYV